MPRTRSQSAAPGGFWSCLAVLTVGSSLWAAVPTGNLDAVDSATCSLRGWVRDPDTPDPIKVRFYRDGPVNTGTLLLEVVADQLRNDLTFPDKNHGFNYRFPIASDIYDNQSHTIYAYAVDATGDPNTLLNPGNIRSLRCNALGVFVNAPRTSLISGERMLLDARSRVRRGDPLTNSDFTWTSNNAAVLSVDSEGYVTAGNLGIATITAVAGTLRGTAIVQVLPLRVELEPAERQILVGDALNMIASALDIRGAPIVGTNFAWSLIGENGGNTQAASITTAGVLRARATGIITVQAQFAYPGGSSQLALQAIGTARVTIRPRPEYRLTRLFSSGDSRTSAVMRPSNRPIVVNENGQVAWTASLDGMTRALMLYGNGGFSVLASSGMPGNPGGVISDFLNLALNNRGEVLARTAVWGSSWGLLLASPENGAVFVVPDGLDPGGTTGLGGLDISRSSLNDQGNFVFRAGFSWQGSTAPQSGLFLYSNGSVQSVVTSSDTLAGLGGQGPPQFGAEIGIANSGLMYFVASRGAARAFYRTDGRGTTANLLATDSAFAGSTVRNLSNLVVGPGGDVGLVVNLSNGTVHVLLYPNGNTATPLSRQIQNWVSNLYSASNGVLLFRGDDGAGFGLYRLQGNTSTLLLPVGRLAPNDEPLLEIDSAGLTSRGEVVAQIRTVSSRFVVARLGGAVLFQSGTRVDLPVNIGFFTMAGGASAGSPHLVFDTTGIYEWTSAGLVARVITGDRPAGSLFTNTSGIARKAAGGELYFGGDDGLYRLRSGQAESVVRFPAAMSDGVSLTANYNRFAVNDRGAMVYTAWTNLPGVARMVLLDRGQMTTAASLGTGTNSPTASPGGGVFSSFGDVAIDERGRVMAFVTVSGGPSGYFLYANDRWTSAALLNQTRVEDTPVSSLDGLRASGARFYARFGNATTGTAVGEFDESWRLVIRRGDPAPNGNLINDVNLFEVNRRNEIAVWANLTGVMGLVVRTADGALHLVQAASQMTEAGDQFNNMVSLDFRDDRRVYFAVLDILDRLLFYEAVALF